MKHRFLLWVAGGIAAISLAVPRGQSAEKVDFVKEIQPILEVTCANCHGATQDKGELRLHTLEAALKGGQNGPAIVVGKPLESKLYTLTILAPSHEDIMPPKGDPLTKAQTDKLKDWIEQGATWPAGVTLKAIKRIDFVKDIQPILEFNCVACHREGHDKGGLKLETREQAFTTGDHGPSIIPGDAAKSRLYTVTTLSKDDPDLMPPANKNGPLDKELIELLRDWINQGASWPADVKLEPKKLEQGGSPAELAAQIHYQIVSNLAANLTLEMKPYTEVIPGPKVKFDLVPIPAGEFIMGSPDNEAGRKSDEGPTHRVAIDPFWMGKCEVTWNEFELFMYPEDERQRTRIAMAGVEYTNALADAVTRPTKPYVEMSFGMGKDGFPAISMTQHAANKYCEWLSAKTGHFYRLPTETEWEYACRAGTTTAYSFGNDAAALEEYAWYGKNSDWKYQKVGTKKPNPWGLHDMHGNVTEWTLDQYDAQYYKQFAGQVITNPWNVAKKPYPHSARGGSWDDENPAMLRSAARRASDPSWKIQDPQLPKSVWYHTDAQFLGFRVVRPLRVPGPDQLSKYWTSGVEKD